MTDGHHDQTIHAGSDQRRQRPSDDGAEVMPDHVGAVDAERVEHGHHVGDAAGDRIVLDRLRPLRLAEAAQVRRDRTQAGRVQCRNLVSP